MFSSNKEQVCPVCGGKMVRLEERIECPQCFWHLRTDLLEESHPPIASEQEELNIDLFSWS